MNSAATIEGMPLRMSTVKLTAAGDLGAAGVLDQQDRPEDSQRHGDRRTDQPDLDGADDGVVGPAALPPRGDTALALQPPA